MAKDVKNELESALGVLSGKGKGTKGKSPRGAERKKMWEEVKALRKECVYRASFFVKFFPRSYEPHATRYRQREGGVVKSVLGESQVRSSNSSGSISFNVIDADRSCYMSFFWWPTASLS